MASSFLEEVCDIASLKRVSDQRLSRRINNDRFIGTPRRAHRPSKKVLENKTRLGDLCWGHSTSTGS